MDTSKHTVIAHCGDQVVIEHAHSTSPAAAAQWVIEKQMQEHGRVVAVVAVFHGMIYPAEGYDTASRIHGS